MPFKFNSKLLEEVTNKPETTQIQDVFDSLVSDLGNYLGIAPIDKNIEVRLTEEELKNSTPILDMGVSRMYKNDLLELTIFSSSKFLPLVILREVYYRFLPREIKDPTAAKIFINQIIENDFHGLNGSKEWHDLIRDNLVDRNFMIGQFERLPKYFKLHAPEGIKDTVQHLFSYIHENALVQTDLTNFYDEVFNDYLYYTSQSLYNEEIMKTLSVLINIFHKDKRYLSITDYTELYKGLLERNEIDSDLSVTKFYENLQWINNYTAIAPTYLAIHTLMGVEPLQVTLTFNPVINRNKVKKIFEKVPFINSPKFIQNQFAYQLSFYMYLPQIYLEDFRNFLRKMEDSGYIINKEINKYNKSKASINLNYFSDISNRSRIIDPAAKTYRKKYEHTILRDYPNSPVYPVSPFEYYLITRLGNFSPAGLTFDKRVETLSLIKEDMESVYRKQLRYIKDFRSTFEDLFAFPEVHTQFKSFIKANKEEGFYYLFGAVESLLANLLLVKKLLDTNSEIVSFFELAELLKQKKPSHIIEENIKFNEGFTKDSVLIGILKKNLDIQKEIKKYQLFYDIFDCCSNLKILNLDSLIKIVNAPEIVKKIHATKEKRFQSSIKEISSYKITNQKVETTIDRMLALDPPLIYPSLINTIVMSGFAKYIPEVCAKYSPEIFEKLGKLKSFFPRFHWAIQTGVGYHDKLIVLLPYTVNIKEKELFISAFYNILGDNLFLFRRLFWTGLTSRKLADEDLYDIDKQQYFYSKDLYYQLYLYSKRVLGEEPSKKKKAVFQNITPKLFWSKNSTMKTLVQAVRTRDSIQKIEFTLQYTNRLAEFRKNLDILILDTGRFKQIKHENFFKAYIKSIRFIPAFSQFGFSKYYLYILPENWDDVDLKLVFTNTFQKIKYPAYIGPDQILYNTFLFPYKNPNVAHVNWLLSSKKSIREYCLFSVKKMYEVIHFDHSISGDKGWQYSPTRFKTYMQDILFNSASRVQSNNIRQFDIDNHTKENIYGPDSQEFQTLAKLYKQKSIDIKSYLGTKKTTIINNIKMLLKKGLIFPYLSLKNLDLQDKVSIILPDIKPEFIDKLVQIFSFFNICHIYETEGEFFLFGFPTVEKFENGLLIEIWFPQCILSEFFNIFDLLFHYLDIKYHLTLTDLVNGKTLIKNVFGNINLGSYKPLTNLKWNKEGRIWMNHKQYTEDFKPIYPDLFYGKKKVEKKKPTLESENLQV